MTRNMFLKLIGAGAASALTFMVVPALAQTAATQATTPTPVAKKPTSATPRMIDEAIQRTQARAAKAAATGVPEQFGSEEPFTYVPGKTLN